MRLLSWGQHNNWVSCLSISYFVSHIFQQIFARKTKLPVIEHLARWPAQQGKNVMHKSRCCFPISFWSKSHGVNKVLGALIFGNRRSTAEIFANACKTSKMTHIAGQPRNHLVAASGVISLSVVVGLFLSCYSLIVVAWHCLSCGERCLNSLNASTPRRKRILGNPLRPFAHACRARVSLHGPTGFFLWDHT